MQALKTLLDHAAAERDQAMTELARAVEAARRLGLQAEQLHAYRSEYQQRWTAQFRRMAAIEVVASYQHFAQRLDQALEQLRLQGANAAREVERARAVLLARETRVASVRKLIERRMGEYSRLLARREQRQTDETAAVAARNLPPALPTEL